MGRERERGQAHIMSEASSSEDDTPLSELAKMYKKTHKRHPIGASVTPFRESIRVNNTTNNKNTITVAVKMNPNKSINDTHTMPC